jgi:F0F1-type ATP synthase membrane subunit b/b'
MFSYAMLYFGTLADKYTTSKMENVVKNLIFYLLPTVIMIYMIYLLFHASVSLYTVSSNSLFAIPKEKPMMMTVDLEESERQRQEAERLRQEAEERDRKLKEEADRLKREAEERQRQEAERIRNAENEAKCGVCY